MWMHSVQFYKAIQRLVTIVKTEDELLKQLGEANDRKQQWFSRRRGIWTPREHLAMSGGIFG